jgi:hypothetical protein
VGTLVPILEGQQLETCQERGVPEAVAMEITGHKTRSMYRRYQIADERDPREATEKLQTNLESQDETKVIPLKSQSMREHGQKTDNLRTERISTVSKLLIVWWSRSGSNRRPLECHSSALPAELRPHDMMQSVMPTE